MQKINQFLLIFTHLVSLAVIFICLAFLINFSLGFESNQYYPSASYQPPEVLGVSAASPEIQVGDLVKAEESSSIYYIASSDLRFVFPNDKTFYTWYQDFSQVKTVLLSELENYSLAGNITYRPGTRLIKVFTNPKVYAVEPGGILRWLKTEDIAETLYGENWQEKVDDLPLIFFTDYTIGDEVSANKYPTGTLIKYPEKEEVYYIDKETKRKISDLGFLENNFNRDFVITAPVEISYPDGEDIETKEALIADVAQLNLPKPGTSPLEIGEAAKIFLSAQKTGIFADGLSTTTITAYIQDENGNLVEEATNTISFLTSHGALSSLAVRADKGKAEVILYSSSTAGTAEVTASSENLTSATIQIEFTLVSSVPETSFLDDPGDSLASNKKYTLNWNSVPTAIKYSIERADNSLFNGPSVFESLTNSYELPKLLPSENKIYFHRVRAINNIGSSDWSNVVDLNTIVTSPKSPNLTDPGYSLETNTLYTINWDPPSFVETYTLQEDTDPLFSSPTNIYTGSDTSFEVTGHKISTIYYYRVKASNLIGSSVWSNTVDMQVTKSESVKVIKVPEDYPSIKSALEHASSKDTIQVAAGTYKVSGLILKDGVSIEGAGADQTILDGRSGTIFYFTNPQGLSIKKATIKGFTLTNGQTGIYANNLVEITIKNNIIKDCTYGIDASGGAKVNIINNTFKGNSMAGIRMNGGSGILPGGVIKNNIIVDNEAGIRCDGKPAPSPSISYNNVWRNSGNLGDYFGCLPGSGDISLDPYFVSAKDYHLRSISSAINAGDPDPIYYDLDNSRNDMGAFGGP